MLATLSHSASSDRIDIPYAAHVVFPADHELRSVAFSPDGSSLYAHLSVPAIDVGTILLGFWPEILATLLVLFTLFVLARWRFVAVRRRERGRRYCRRCNYEVVTLDRKPDPPNPPDTAVPPSPESPDPSPYAAISKCPECGVDLSPRNIIPGRSTLRRLRWLIALWLVAALGYASLYVLKVPRQGVLTQWTSLCRKDLAEWATRKQYPWLVSRITQCALILELDPASGATRRTVATLPRQAYDPLSISDDGRFLFLSATNSSVSCINTRTGRVNASSRLPGTPSFGSEFRAVIATAPDSSLAYVQWHDAAGAISGVSEWNLTTGAVNTVLTEKAYIDTRQVPHHNWPRHFLVRLAPDSPPAFLSYPDFMESFPSGKYIVRIRESDKQTREFTLVPPPDPSSDPAWRYKDQQIVAVTNYGEGLTGWSLTDGSHLGVITGVSQTGMGDIAHDRDARFLLFGFSDIMQVRDAVAMRWLATLKCPPAGYGAKPVMSLDGAWCAAIFQVSLKTPAGYSFELATWRLDAPKLAREHEESLKSP